jgi:hypothetical protein
MSSSGKKDLGSTKGGKTLHQGLYRKNPHACDKSTSLPTKTSVNSDATRTQVGRATNALGPRSA